MHVLCCKARMRGENGTELLYAKTTSYLPSAVCGVDRLRAGCGCYLRASCDVRAGCDVCGCGICLGFGKNCGCCAFYRCGGGIYLDFGKNFCIFFIFFFSYFCIFIFFIIIFFFPIFFGCRDHLAELESHGEGGNVCGQW